MAQIGADSFAADDRLMRVDEAVALLFARVRPVQEVETVAVAEAGERILAHDIAAPLDLPGFDNSAVDGYAVRFEDLAPGAETALEIGGRAAAGHLCAETSPHLAGKAVRIFTGAAVPEGFDTVFMQEDCRAEKNRVILPPGL